MDRSHPEKADLLSWKEVSQYLGCSVRTAQKWEKEKGLPVHRMPGTAGQVLASPEEIDAWKAHVQKNRPWWLRTDFRAYYAVALPVLVLLLAAHDIYYHHLSRAEAPASYRLGPHELIVLGRSGEEVWRKFFDVPFGARGDSLLRNDREPIVRIVDLLGDGVPEVLFVRTVAGFGKDVLYVYSSTGSELWRFEAPNQRRSDFLSAITSLAVSTAGPDRRIYVLSCRSPYHFSTVHSIKSNGEATEILEHQGHLDTMDISDIDRDGGAEIVVGGIDGASRQANLHVLDPTLGLQSELLFSRTRLNERLSEGNRVTRIMAEPGRIRVGVEEWMGTSSGQACYLLDEHLKPEVVTFCGSMQSEWHRMSAEKNLDLPSLETEAERLKREIRVVR